MCFVCEWKFQFLVILNVLGVKNGMPIPFPRSFWLLICGSMRQNKYFFMSKSEKHLETRLHDIRAYLMRKTCVFTRSLQKKVSEFNVSELVTSFSISSTGPLVFSMVLMTMRVFFVVNTIGKARDAGTLNYQLTGNS